MVWVCVVLALERSKKMSQLINYRNFPHYVGFDRIFEEMVRQMERNDVGTGYPPYNVINVEPNKYVVELAVAGYGKEDISITEHNGELIIEGDVAKQESPSFLYKGISSKKFRRSFTLADYVRVEKAEVINGILRISLVREVPEEFQPRKIAIDFKG